MNQKDDEFSITNPSETGYAVSLDGLPKDALRAIIKKLNEKSQSSTIGFKDKHIVSIDNIKQIIEKIHQEFNSCKIISVSVSVRLILKNKQSFDFYNWDDFISFDSSINERTSSLVVEITYDVFRGQEITPERYSIEISISNYNVPPSFMISGSSEDISDIIMSTNFSDLMVKVEYNNYILGKNIISTVQSWGDGLELKETNKWISIKQSSRLNFYITLIGWTSGFLFSLAIPNILFNIVSENNLFLYYCILLSSASIFLFGIIGARAGDIVERSLDSRGLQNTFTLTNGDRKWNSEVRNKNKSLISRAFIFCSIAVGELIVGGIAATIFYRISSILK